MAKPPKRLPIGWLKAWILPAAKTYTSRKIAAGAIVAASISGFRFVQPIDDTAKTFRIICLVTGTLGFVGLIVLFFMPPRP
jgi:hypothetical protein